jgi:hypothetical protein
LDSNPDGGIVTLRLTDVNRTRASFYALSIDNVLTAEYRFTITLLTVAASLSRFNSNHHASVVGRKVGFADRRPIADAPGGACTEARKCGGHFMKPYSIS